MLYTPGPVDVHPTVRAAYARPPQHHRSDEFLEVSQRTWKNLSAVFQHEGTTALMAGSGMTGIEAAMSSLHADGASILVLSHGRFGDRLKVIGECYGLSVIYRAVEWGDPLSASLVREAIRSHTYVDGVWMVHAETSTGVATDLEQYTAIIREHAPEALIGVDVVTSLGVQEVAFDRWGLDVAVTGMQKGLACAPGLAAIALSERAEHRPSKTEGKSYTLNLQTVLESQQRGLFTWTPPVTLIVGLDVALQQVLDEGLQARWATHARRHDELTTLLLRGGATVFGDGSAMGVVVAQHQHSDDIRDRLRQAGFTIAGGQDHLQGRIMRIGTMGYHTTDEHDQFLEALRTILRETK